MIIVDTGKDGASTPFLRGILTRSLQKAGVSFDESYALASTVKDSLAGGRAITNEELRSEVVQLLSRHYSADIIEHYQKPTNIYDVIQVLDSVDNNNSARFSLTQHNRSMYAAGLSPEIATSVTREVFKDLHLRKITELESNELGHLTCSVLRNQVGERAVQRYLIWANFSRQGDPLHILIGGATGTGKSTIATDIAHRLGIIRTQSTDMLREVMRMMTPERLIPTLHTSSFNAWKVQPRTREQEQLEPTIDNIISGYLAQAKEVSVSSNAIIQRAQRESVSLVLEGIHNHPTLMEEIKQEQKGIVIPLMLAVIKRSSLKKRIKGRGSEATHRRAKRYINQFDAIWDIQNFLLDEADQLNIPIIHNIRREEALEQIMLAINNSLAEKYSISEDKLFGAGEEITGEEITVESKIDE